LFVDHEHPLINISYDMFLGLSKISLFSFHNLSGYYFKARESSVEKRSLEPKVLYIDGSIKRAL
jgi:hypothetical protein